MAAVTSAGILLFRLSPRPEVLLGHPGGPFFVRKDDGVWSIPKGEYGPDEDALAAARREFAEEIGTVAPAGDYLPLGAVEQRRGKLVTVWAIAGDLDVGAITSNPFELEWPPHSGRTATFPELDRAAWFDLDTAARKLVVGQRPFLDRLRAALDR